MTLSIFRGWLIPGLSICLTVLAGIISPQPVRAQTALATSDSVAVFYPKDYDASLHQPSPIFVNEPAAILPLTQEWQLRPLFSQRECHSVATISVGSESVNVIKL